MPRMPNLILFNKPFNVLSQFTGDEAHRTLSGYIPEPGFYPAGRLDKDSEGLMLLTDCGETQQRISHPRFKLPKTYWAQVEGQITEHALRELRKGVALNDGPTRPASALAMSAPELWQRHPPIRVRKHIPDSWLALTISEGRNRQVRRMTAAVGFPTLRLVRHQVGHWTLDGLQPGEYRIIRIADDWWRR